MSTIGWMRRGRFKSSRSLNDHKQKMTDARRQNMDGCSVYLCYCIDAHPEDVQLCADTRAVLRRMDALPLEEAERQIFDLMERWENMTLPSIDVVSDDDE